MATDRDAPKLRRDLKLWQVIALSVGLMAPSMAISINPQGAIGAVGRAIPLSFVIAMAGALLVAYGFSRLSQHFHNSGSVLGLVGATLGARAGVVAAWCLAGTYLLFSLLTGVTAGIFGVQLLQSLGWIHDDPGWLVFTIGGVLMVASGLFAVAPVARATDVILSFEGVTISMILVAAIVVASKLLGHSGPGHLGLTWTVFSPAKGTTTSNVFLGVVFGFLSFGGFEAAATLGGEASRPRRDIPTAMFATVVLIGLFYVAISAIEVMGFGTSRAGLDDFSQSPALVGTLAQTYVAKWFGDLIILGTIVSAFGCSVASAVGCSRIVYSFARDGLRRGHPLARVSSRWGTPAVAVGLVVALEVILTVAVGAGAGAAPLTVFEWTAYISTLLILTAYGMVTIGTIAFLFVQPFRRGDAPVVRRAEIVVPVAGAGLLVYTIYRNLDPLPAGANRWQPVIAGLWLVVSLVYVVGFPAASRRLGRRLVTDEGMTPLTPVATSA